jgi:putative membrane protein
VRLLATVLVGLVALVLVFSLACVVVAGLCGAATASRRILLVQALPRFGLGAVLLAR